MSKRKNEKGKWLRVIEDGKAVGLFENGEMIDYLKGKIDIESTMRWKMGLEELETFICNH